MRKKNFYKHSMCQFLFFASALSAIRLRSYVELDFGISRAKESDTDDFAKNTRVSTCERERQTVTSVARIMRDIATVTSVVRA